MGWNGEKYTAELKEKIAVNFFDEMDQLEEKYIKICDEEFSSCWDECVMVRDELFHRSDIKKIKEKIKK